MFGFFFFFFSGDPQNGWCPFRFPSNPTKNGGNYQLQKRRATRKTPLPSPAHHLAGLHREVPIRHLPTSVVGGEMDLRRAVGSLRVPPVACFFLGPLFFREPEGNHTMVWCPDFETNPSSGWPQRFEWGSSLMGNQDSSSPG